MLKPKAQGIHSMRIQVGCMLTVMVFRLRILQSENELCCIQVFRGQLGPVCTRSQKTKHVEHQLTSWAVAMVRTQPRHVNDRVRKKQTRSWGGEFNWRNSTTANMLQRPDTQCFVSTLPLASGDSISSNLKSHSPWLTMPKVTHTEQAALNEKQFSLKFG